METKRIVWLELSDSEKAIVIDQARAYLHHQKRKSNTFQMLCKVFRRFNKAI